MTLSVGCDAVEVEKESAAKVGEPFTYAGICKDTVFTTIGEHTVKRTYTAVSGCDSIVTLTVNVDCPTIEKEVKASIQSGESYSFATLFADRVFVKSGTYQFTDKLKSVYGCDSVVNLTLSVGCEPKENEKILEAYIGVPFSYDNICKDTLFANVGTKIIEKAFLMASGCDSIVRLIVKVENRDSFYYKEKDAICEGLDYISDNWNLNVSDSLPSIYEFTQELGNSAKTDTFRVLNLHIIKNDHAIIEELRETPTICVGGRYGSVDFVLDRNLTTTLSVQLFDSRNSLVKSEKTQNQSDYIAFNGIASGDYSIKIAKISDDQCFSDTTFSIKIEEADPITIVGVDTIYTGCISEPTAHCELEVTGYHASVSLKMNERAVQRYKYRDRNCYVVQDNYDPTKATIHIDSLAEGVYLFDAYDYCGNEYKGIHKLVVKGPKPLKIEKIKGHTELACNRSDDGSVMLRLTGGSLLSRLNMQKNSGDEVYPMTGDTTIVELKDLEGGVYPLTYSSGIDNCSDHVSMDIEIKAPKPLKADLMVNGIVCQDAVITAYTSGENGEYSYRWVKPNGDTISTSDNHLSNVGAGRYECIVEDKGGCSKISSFAMVSPIESLSPLKLISVSVDETCYASDNAKIGVLYYNNNAHQAVTCSLENAETGEEIKSMTSMLYWGSFVLEDVAPGTYKIRLRYGTRNCNLSLDEVTKILEVKAKQKPLIIAEPIVTDATCYSIPNGTIELNVSGWEGNYKGRLDGKEVNPISVSKDSVAKFVFQSLKGGKYRFDVEDECKEQESSIDINVNQIKPYTLTYIDGADKLECAHDNTGYVRFKVEGGYYGHNNLYSTNGDLSKVIGKDTTVVYSGLKKGAYLVVYESEVEGCPDKAILEYEVQAPEPLAMDLQLNGVNCPNGGLVAKTSGERRPYIYEWSTESSIRRTLSSRCPFVLEYGKTYQCKVRDLHGCDSVIRKVTIPSPDELPTLAVKGVGHTESCYRGNNGCITMQVSSERRIPYGVVVSCAFAPIGGTYTEKTSTMGNNWSLSSEKNLAPGKYSVRVHYGAAGCDMGLPSVYDTVEVIALQPVEIASDMQVKDVTCLKEPNGRISFEVNGWSETHKASLNQLSFQTINLFLFSINMPVFTVKEIRPVSVEGQKAIFELSNLESGTYFISVTDKCGNSSDNKSFGIRNAINPFRINVLSMEDELRCNYSKEGMVKLQLTGGNPDANVFYQEGEASISIKKDTVMVFSELGAGKYRFHFLSTEEGCSDHVSYEMNVSPANEFKQHLSLEGEPCKDQKLEAIIEGGAEPYKVTWKTENGVTVEIDEAGKYELTSAGTGSFYCETVDQKGCRYNSDTVKAVLIDSENMMLAIDTLIMEPTKCYSSEDGLIKVAISGNTAMSKIEARLFFGSELKQAIESNAEKDTLIFKDLGYGKYDVSLVYAEAEDCSLSNKAQGSILVESPTNLKITMNHVPVACDVDHGGKAIAMIEGGMAPYTIEWRNEIDEEHGLHQTRDIDTLKGLALDSSYYCVVKDSNECEQISGKVRITKMNLENLLIDKFAYTKTVLCSGQNNARVTVSLRSRDERVPVKVSVRNESGIQNSVVIAENEKDGVVDGIAPGDYVVDIAYDDADACSSVFDSAITISPLEPLALSNIEMTHQVTCHNPANGGLKFDVSGWAETHVAAVVTKGDTLYLMPKSVEGQLAHFEESSLLGGDYVFVKDFCGDKREGITDLQTFEDYKVEVVAEKLKLRCNYSTDGFVEVKIEKGSHKNNKLYLVKKNGGNWELASDVVYDLDLEEPMQKRYSDLSAGTYRIIYQSNEEGCQDNAYQERTVEVPAPIRFIQAVKPAACSDVASGEFAITPYRYMADVKYVKLDDSENMALEVVDKKTSEYKVFPGVVDMNFYIIENGELKDATAKLDTFMYSGGGADDDTDPTRVEITNPYKGMWEWKNGDWTCPKYWIGFESLPSSIFCLKVTDDSACVFVDTLKVNDPKYGELKIEEVKFDADYASCHADHRYMEIYVKGGWGKYAYIVDPLNKDEDDDDFPSQTYEAGDSTWAANGKGYYRTPILDPGIYKVAVVDSFGCKDSLLQTIEVKAKINVNGDVKADPCGGSESTITVHPSVVSSYAVYEPYSYAVRREDKSIGEKVQGGYKEKVLTSIPKGTIGIYVYDGNGCSGYATFNVNGTDTSFVPMTAYSMKTLPVKCYGSEEGEIVFRAYGAFPPYKAFYMDDDREPMDVANLVFAEVDEKLEKTGVTYHLDEDGLDPTKKDTFCLTNLKGGKHTLTIVDSKNCKQKMEYTIKEPSALVVNSLTASPVCPNSTEGKISVKVSGGTSPYEYGFIEGTTISYQENEFLAAPQGVAKRISIKDANGCTIETGAATVNGTFDTDNVDQSCIVSTWQDFDDVLVFIDNSVVKEQYDSSKFVLDETNFIKGVTYKVCNPIFYTYGIPDTIESIKLWNGEDLKGPMWGIPSDIAAGVKDQAHYQEEQVRINASMDTYKADLKKYNESTNKSKSDSIKLSNTYALIMQQWRVNCTESMIKSTFKNLVDPSMAKRMTFIQFSSSTDLQKLMKPTSATDSVLFDYGFKHILYVAGCDLTTEHSSIKIAKEGIKPYESLTQRDIIAVYANPNPVDANQTFTVTAKFSTKVDFEVQAYNMLGVAVTQEPVKYSVNDAVWTEENENDSMVYVAKCEMNLPSTSVVVVKTAKDQASTTVVVTSATNSGN
ncbi:MAG: hypothetical protein MJZ33_10765 [Paludibacteraceae bacterium]|nr:hypothetical protein [Paludibacteraceae bacterium]